MKTPTKETDPVPPDGGKPPYVKTASIGEKGQPLTVVFDRSVISGSDGPNIFVISRQEGEGDIYLTYASGDGGDTWSFEMASTALKGQVVTLIYSQPGDGVKDTAETLLESATDIPITNNSTQ